MNITELRCAIKFLGWNLKSTKRESLWKDENNNFIAFTDMQIVTRLNNKVTKYGNICNIQAIYEEVLETIENDKKRANTDSKDVRMGYPF